MRYEIISVKTTGGKVPGNGRLSVLEDGGRDLPFEVKRLYWVYEVDEDIRRGFHAHKETWQFLFCPYGSIEIMLDDGEKKEYVTLDSPDKGLLLPPELWHEMLWKKPGSVLCVAASEYYDEADYIRDYDRFLEHARNLK